jgi:hypothetical protein
MRLPLTRILQSALLCIALLAPSMASAQDITTDLEAHWKLDETSGTTAIDSSGNGNNGTLSGFNASANAAGIDGTALSFDGFNDYISAPSIASTTQTISAWVYHASRPSGIDPDYVDAILWKNQDNQAGFWGIDLGSNGQVATKRRNSLNQNIFCTSSNIVPLNTWSLVTAVLDSATATIKVYLNGTLDNTCAATNITTSSGGWYIGKHNAGKTYDFHGRIDDVRIYNRALSDTDVEQLYAPALFGRMRYNDESEAVEYHNGAGWFHTGLGSYSPNGVTFDGTNDYVIDTPAIDDSKRMTGSFWFRRDTADTSVDAAIHTRTGSALNIDARADGSGGDIFISARNAGGTTILRASSSTNTNDGDWHHVLFSFDLADTGKRHLYIDGVSELATTTYTDDTMRLTGFPHAIGADTAGANKLNGDLADYWFEAGTYIDLSVAANRQKFISDNGVPMYLGSDGTLPLGKSPDIFLSGATDDWHTNKGTGGGFTENGALTDSSTQPGNSVYSPDVTNGLIGHWKLDETSGTVAVDSSSSGINGTYENITLPTQSIAGRYDTAVNFIDGSFNRVNIGDNYRLTGSPFTLSAWINPTTITIQESIIDKLYASQGYRLRFDINKLRFDIRDASGTVESLVSPINPISTGVWQHVLVTYDDATTANMYVNGALIASKTDFTITKADGTSPLYIGRNRNNSDWFDGGIDDVRIYDRVLSSTEVSTLYNFSDGGSCSTPDKIKGSIIYNDDDKVMQYCNGTEYVAMGPVGGTGGSGCAGPTGIAGELMYNEDYAVLQYCNAEDWVAVGRTANDFYDVGLEAYWTLNETSGGVITDSSGNGRSGTWRDNVNDDVTEETVAGKVSNAIEFDGNNDRIFMGTNPGLLEGESEGSVCLWMNHTGSITSDHAMVAKFDAAAMGSDGIYMFIDDVSGISGKTDTVSFVVQVQGFANGRVEGTSSLVTSGAWDHYCGTFKGNTFIRLYKNGVLNAENTTSIVSNFATMPALHFRVGNEEGSVRGFNGALDEVRIYHRALTSGEVAALYNATK